MPFNGVPASFCTVMSTLKSQLGVPYSVRGINGKSQLVNPRAPISEGPKTERSFFSNLLIIFVVFTD